MSALIVSDLHAENWTRFSTILPNGQNSRFVDLLDVLAQIEILIIERNPEWLLVLGDLFHRRRYVQFSIYTEIMYWLRQMRRKYAVKIVLLVGNHDVESHGHHALEPLSFLDGVTVVDRPGVIEINDQPHLFVPWMPVDDVPKFFEGDDFGRAMDGVNYRDSFAFLHYSFDGKIVGSGEYAVPSVLKKSHLDGFEKIFLGHVHAPSVEDDGRIVYVGAPLHFDFGDTGDRFAWHLLPSGQIEALPLSFPKFVTASYPRVPVASLDKSGFLRVLGVPRALFGDVKKSAIENGWRDSLLIEQRLPDEAIKLLAASSVMVSDEMIHEYVNRQYPDVDAHTRAEIIAIGQRFLREAEQ